MLWSSGNISKSIDKSNSTAIIRIGLAIVFISNALMPFLASDDYIDLVNHSFLVQLFHVNPQTFGMFTGLNDATVALLLILGWHTRYVGAYAFFWIIGVMTIYGIGHYLDVLEHIGFLSMSMYLLIATSKKKDNDLISIK